MDKGSCQRRDGAQKSMMKIDDIVNGTDTYRSELCKQVQNDSGVECVMLEKDIWVTYVLEKIFADKELSKILRFKGGTSLSKAHRIIRRFSEDVDLVLDWTRFLEIGDPNEMRSKTQQARYNVLMNATAGSYVSGELRDRIQGVIGDVCKVGLDPVEPLNLHVAYPKCFSNSYITPDVKLEIGPLASWSPWESKPVTSLVGEFEPQLEIQSFDVPAIKVERTFWEKIEALHHEHYRPETKKAPKRFSRHYYDVYRMYCSGVLDVAKNDFTLLADIVDFTSKFYPRSWAHFELCKPGTMLLMPSEHAMPVMKADYAAMRNMIYGEYPSFDEILSTIKNLELEINSCAAARAVKGTADSQ